MPCARLPRLVRGFVDAPTILVAHHGLWPLELERSPFHGLRDVYAVRDLGTTDSAVDPAGITVLWIERNPGESIAHPDTSTP
jgi:hypothetical protein